MWNLHQRDMKGGFCLLPAAWPWASYRTFPSRSFHINLMVLMCVIPAQGKSLMFPNMYITLKQFGSIIHAISCFRVPYLLGSIGTVLSLEVVVGGNWKATSGLNVSSASR